MDDVGERREEGVGVPGLPLVSLALVDCERKVRMSSSHYMHGELNGCSKGLG